MREELKRIEKMEEYINNSLPQHEKEEMHQEVSQNEETREEIATLGLLLTRIKRIVLRNRVKAIGNLYFQNDKPWFQRWSWKPFSLLVLIGITLGVFFLTEDESPCTKQIEVAVANKQVSFIHPPSERLNVPFHKDSVASDKNVVLNYDSGTTILIPKEALIDVHGNLVVGNVEVAFREFHDPVDFYLSGIPMTYTEGDQEFTFESAGMCELKVTQNGKELQLVAGKRIEVLLASDTSNETFNLYRFNETKGVWNVKGKDAPENLVTDYLGIVTSELAKVQTKKKGVAPIKPKITNTSKQTFTLNYSAQKYPELAGFKNVVFEMDDSYKKLDRSYSGIVWSDVDVKRGHKKGSYLITFSKPKINKSITYQAFPTFNEKDYPEAMKLYHQKMKQFQSIKSEKERLLLQRKQELLAKKHRIDSINNVVQKRNRLLLKKRTIVLKENLSIEERNRKVDSINKAYVIAYNKKKVSIEAHNKKVDSLNKIYVKEFKEQKIKMAYDRLNRKRVVAVSSRFLNAQEKSRLVLEKDTYEFLVSIKEGIDALYEKHRLELNKQRYKPGLKSMTLRKLQLDGFGIWNCDRFKNESEAYDFVIDFKTSDHTTLNYITMMDKTVKGIF